MERKLSGQIFWSILIGLGLGMLLTLVLSCFPKNYWKHVENYEEFKVSYVKHVAIKHHTWGSLKYKTFKRDNGRPLYKIEDRGFLIQVEPGCHVRVKNATAFITHDERLFFVDVNKSCRVTLIYPEPDHLPPFNRSL